MGKHCNKTDDHVGELLGKFLDFTNYMELCLHL